MPTIPLPVLALLLAIPTAGAGAQVWKPAEGPLQTRWAAEVDPASPHPEYPRPQLQRAEWQSLNGLWSYAIVEREEGPPVEADGEILVPFPVESSLSGVGRRLSSRERLWCWRDFVIPESWRGQRVLLNFGAVDWEAEVWIDGMPVATHRGGYDPFTVDMTPFLGIGESRRIAVAIWDPTDEGFQPRGKQVREPGGIWYTPTSGIWRTVWIEPVPETSLMSLRLTPELSTASLQLEAQLRGPAADCSLNAAVFFGGKEIKRASARPDADGSRIALDIQLPEVHPWSPDHPDLYQLQLTLDGGSWTDRVQSYFGLREIRLGADESGVQRLLLNGEPLFQYGTLDQGFWPDGLYTAPTDAALRYDLEVTKELGFNTVRKHVKIEPERWYYWCDVLGLLVWQDMPSGERYIGGRDPDIERTPESAQQFLLELERNIDALSNHPSIVMWVPYNEGWGQWDTERVTAWIAGHDPTRLVNSASGWTDRGVGHVLDIHSYPGPATAPLEEDRAIVLGEFGGLGLPLPDHTWQTQKNWGYRSFEDSAALTEAYLQLLANLRPLIGQGLAAAIYTQTTDVEIEVNGLLTYDRALIKMDAARAAEAARALYLPPPVLVPIVATSQQAGRIWRYTTSAPEANWASPGFDDSGWSSGPGGFGTEGTPGAVVRTVWDSEDIWLRRGIELTELTAGANLALLIHHDEDAEVYVDGERIASPRGYTSAYVLEPLDELARTLLMLRPGTLAVHCHQTGGGQYVDVGIVEVREDGDR